MDSRVWGSVHRYANEGASGRVGWLLRRRFAS